MRHDSFQTLSFLHPSPIRKLLKSLSLSFSLSIVTTTFFHERGTQTRENAFAPRARAFHPFDTRRTDNRHLHITRTLFARNYEYLCDQAVEKSSPSPIFLFFTRTEREKSFDLNNSSNRDEYEARYLRHEKQILNRYFEIRIVSRNETILKQ